MRTISLSHLIVFGLAFALASSIPLDVTDDRDVDEGLGIGTENYEIENDIAVEDLTYQRNQSCLTDLEEQNEKLAQTEEELDDYKNGIQELNKEIDDLLEKVKEHQDTNDKTMEEKQQLCDIVADCDDETVQQLCRPYKCLAVDGGFSSWSDWREEGPGNKIRERTCDHPNPQYGGNNCSGDFTETQACGCDVTGSESPNCNDSWICTCKAEYKGDKCDSCGEGYEKFGTECIDIKRVDAGATVVFEVVSSEDIQFTLKSPGIEDGEIAIISENTGVGIRNDEGYGVQQNPFNVEKLEKGGLVVWKLSIGNVLPAYAGRVDAMIDGRTFKSYQLVVSGIWRPMPFQTDVSPGGDMELKITGNANSAQSEKWFGMKYLGEHRWESWKEISNDNRLTVDKKSNAEGQNVFTLTVANITTNDTLDGYQLQVRGVTMTTLIHVDVTIDVQVTTKNYGAEISWTLGPCSNSQSYGNYNNYAEQCELPSGSYTLTCKDSAGDGWHGGYLKIQGTKYCEDFSHGSQKVLQIIVTGY